MIKKNLPTILLIFFGSIILISTMFRSGLSYPFGVGFWGPNAHDGLWHLSLINQIKLSIPPANPIYSGTLLSNYHWGFDLVVALLSKILFINPFILYFQILPFIFAIFIGFLSYVLSLSITKNKITAFFFVFLNYFAGSFGYTAWWRLYFFCRWRVFIKGVGESPFLLFLLSKLL